MSEPTPFSKMLYGLLERAELIALAFLIGSLGAQFAGYTAAMSVIVFAFAALAGIYFLMAYRPLAYSPPSDAKPGFKELLAYTILPKVMWIGAAVGAAGFSILHTQPDNDGYLRLLLISAAVTLLNALMVGVFVLQGTETKHIIPGLYRAVPLALAAIYVVSVR